MIRQGRYPGSDVSEGQQVRLALYGASSTGATAAAGGAVSSSSSQPPYEPAAEPPTDTERGREASPAAAAAAAADVLVDAANAGAAVSGGPHAVSASEAVGAGASASGAEGESQDERLFSRTGWFISVMGRRPSRPTGRYPRYNPLLEEEMGLSREEAIAATAGRDGPGRRQAESASHTDIQPPVVAADMPGPSSQVGRHVTRLPHTHASIPPVGPPVGSHGLAPHSSPHVAPAPLTPQLAPRLPAYPPPYPHPYPPPFSPPPAAFVYPPPGHRSVAASPPHPHQVAVVPMTTQPPRWPHEQPVGNLPCL